MISQKLLSLLQSFSKSEMKSFSKFLRSPFHNENEELVQLFNLINLEFQKTAIDINENSQFEKNVVWFKIKKNEPYKDEQLRRLCSDLTKQAYSFLAHKNLKENPINEIVYLLPEINTPKLNKHFAGTIRQAIQIQNKSKLKNADYHFSEYKINFQQYVNVEKNTPNLPNFKYIEKADYHLDAYYILNKLKNYCDFLIYKNIITVNPSIYLFPNFLENLKSSPYIEEPCIKVYYNIVSMLISPEEESFYHNAKKISEENFDSFSHQELNTIYIYLKNYCIDTKINKGKSEYFHELFAISKTLLKKEINFTNGMIRQQDYKNIITVGLHIKEFDWTENFIQKYTNRLPKESQDSDLSYNLAKVHFHKKEYEKVIEKLRFVEYKTLPYTMGGRLMLLKTYYELKELDALESLLDSYSIYLRRNKFISREVKQQLMNGIRFTRKLSSLAPYDKRGIQKLKDQINNCKALAAKKWLIEKVDELVN